MFFLPHLFSLPFSWKRLLECEKHKLFIIPSGIHRQKFFLRCNLGGTFFLSPILLPLRAIPFLLLNILLLLYVFCLFLSLNNDQFFSVPCSVMNLFSFLYYVSNFFYSSHALMLNFIRCFFYVNVLAAAFATSYIVISFLRVYFGLFFCPEILFIL